MSTVPAGPQLSICRRHTQIHNPGLPGEAAGYFRGRRADAGLHLCEGRRRREHAGYGNGDVRHFQCRRWPESLPERSDPADYPAYE